MYPFQYNVSFHIRHPSIDPADITRALAVVPTRSSCVGEPRKTPAGTPLAGVYPDTHWYREYAHSPEALLGSFLEVLIKDLARHASFLHKLREDGGSSWISVGWYTGVNSGEQFSSNLLKQMGNLDIDLWLDVYSDVTKES
jgi:hypothetical protein